MATISLFIQEIIYLFIVFYSGELILMTKATAIKDYCFWETFTANCKNNEAIVMQSVLYGLMKESRCVDDNHLDYVGCSSNQLDYFDNKCSGLRTCEVIVHNKEMKDKIKTMCPEPYIEASYICQPVVGDSSKCTSSKSIEIKPGPHYISSLTSVETECGYGNTPWILTAKPGQQINFTLVDFAWGSRQTGNWNSRNKCQQLYGHLLSVDGNIVEICGGTERMKYLYSSGGHQVQVVIQQDLPQEVKFLIQFEATGCPDYIPPKNTWLRKEGSNIVIGCHTSSAKWQLKCVGSHWIGVIGNCTQAEKSQNVAVTEDKGDNFTNHHVFAVAIGCLAVIVCCITVTIGIYCIRRYKIKVKTGNDKSSELYLMPNTTWTRGNESTIIRDHINTSLGPGNNVQSAGTNVTQGHSNNHTGLNALNREDTTSVQYFVLEKPPGYN